jgi:hypothetical protein
VIVLEPVTCWHWWALAGGLAAIEAFAPGFALLWLGLAAGLVGLILLLVPDLALAWQLVAFSALAVTSVLSWRSWQTGHPLTSDRPGLNQRGASYLGRRALLVEPIVNGHGRVRIADGTWTVRGPDLPAGAAVEVCGVEGVVLTVRPVTAPPSEAADPRPAAPEPPANEGRIGYSA